MSTQRREDEEMHTPLLDVEHVFTSKVKSAWQGFQDFALRENVLEVAVGLMYVSLLGGDLQNAKMNQNCGGIYEGGQLTRSRYYSASHIPFADDVKTFRRKVHCASERTPLYKAKWVQHAAARHSRRCRFMDIWVRTIFLFSFLFFSNS